MINDSGDLTSGQNILIHLSPSPFFLFHLSRPDRLREIADRFNLDHSAMLDNVLYARAYTSKGFCYRASCESLAR